MNTIVIEAKQCPNCGKLMAGGPLAGLCPACLLAQGSAESQAAASKPPFVPPPIDEIRKLFPQLEIISLLGSGGMGAVFKARQPALDRWVALKVLPAENSSGVNFAERFNREARALAKLNHPNIVTVHEFGQAGALHYFIMEFVDGANLRQLEQAGRLSSREALQIIPQICDALQYAHDEGVVHRDIKPENVLVDRKGRVKIADFGLAKIIGADLNAQRLTVEGQVMGTPHYMAPEQVEKPLSVDHRADIYALGVVFYEMLTGDLPLGKFPPPSRKVQIDLRLDDVVLRALENDPERRYQQASEVKSQVETITSSPGSAPAVPPEREPRFFKWAGFPLLLESDGKRRLHRRGMFHAFGIIFGLLTLAFGIVSLISGRSLFGWFGIVGGWSLQVRLLISAAVVAWALWRAKSSETAESLSPLTGPWWTKKRNGIAIGIACGVLILAVAARPHSSHPKPASAPRVERPLANQGEEGILSPNHTVAEMPPVVVATEPAAGTRDVSPGTTEIRVRFSKEMMDGSWSWTRAWDGSGIKIVDGPSYDADRKTCVITVKLERHRTYGLWLNSEKFQNFKDTAGRPAVPYLLVFKTKD